MSRVERGFHRVGLFFGFWPVAAGMLMYYTGNGTPQANAEAGYCVLAGVAVYLFFRAIGWVINGFSRTAG
jgi:hypothetical protein